MKQPNVQGIKRYIRPITWGIAAGAVSCTLLLVIAAVIMGLRDIPESIVALISTISFIIGGFVAGYISAALSREKGMVVGLCCGMCLFIILLLASLAVEGAGLGLAAFTKLLCVLLASAIGGILGVNKRKKFKC